MYSEELISFALAPTTNNFLTAAQIGGSVADYQVWNVMEGVTLTRLMFFVKTLVASSTANEVYTFYQRPTSGSTSGQVALGTLTIPTASAVGQVIYKDIESVKLLPGQDLAIKRTTQGTDGSSVAGAGFLGFKAFSNVESPLNVTAMVKSA